MGNMDSKAKLWCAWWTPLLSLAVPFTLSCRGIVAVGWSERPTHSARALVVRNSHRSHGNFIAHNNVLWEISTAGKVFGTSIGLDGFSERCFFSENVKQKKNRHASWHVGFLGCSCSHSGPTQILANLWFVWLSEVISWQVLWFYGLSLSFRISAWRRFADNSKDSVDSVKGWMGLKPCTSYCGL